MYIHETKCPDCRQYIEQSFTVNEDGVVRCLDCGARNCGQFGGSVAYSKRLLAAYGPFAARNQRWKDDCPGEYIP